MKFLHTADWQLGRVFRFESNGEGHDPSGALAQARFDAVAGSPSWRRRSGSMPCWWRVMFSMRRACRTLRCTG